MKIQGVKNVMSKSNLTEEQAFLAMYSFLDEYYQMIKSDDVGALLGSMSLLNDGGTVDPAIKSAWKTAVKRALDGKINAQLGLR